MRLTRYLTTLGLALYVLIPVIVFAQGRGLPARIVPCDGTALNGGIECRCTHLIQLTQNIVDGAIYFAVFFSAVLFAYAGWLYLSNAALSQKDRGRTLFVNVAIGLVVILSAWLVVDTLMRQLAGTSFGGSWSELCRYFEGGEGGIPVVPGSDASGPFGTGVKP